MSQDASARERRSEKIFGHVVDATLAELVEVGERGMGSPPVLGRFARPAKSKIAVGSLSPRSCGS